MLLVLPIILSRISPHYSLFISMPSPIIPHIIPQTSLTQSQ